VTKAILQELTDLGVALWLDDLDRSRLQDGALQHLVDKWCIRGVTTNPTIFHKAISQGHQYASDLDDLRNRGASADEIVWEMTIEDVKSACDLLVPVWESTHGLDGRVSLEVDPRLAHDTDGTVAQAHELWQRLDRRNAFIKIPATPAGIPAIAECIAAGISVNVTLIFSVTCYAQVISAYITGLERAHAAGRDLRTISSVASFFISRVDTAVDEQLRRLGTRDATDLLGRAAIANACAAWECHRDALADPRWGSLAASGAQPQRPLWASTGVKNPDYDPTRYVVDLAVAGSVNTMPESTLHAVADTGVFAGDRVTSQIPAAHATLTDLKAVGIDLDATLDELQRSGVAAFQESWTQLLADVRPG